MISKNILKVSVSEIQSLNMEIHWNSSKSDSTCMAWMAHKFRPDSVWLWSFPRSSCLDLASVTASRRLDMDAGTWRRREMSWQLTAELLGNTGLNKHCEYWNSVQCAGPRPGSTSQNYIEIFNLCKSRGTSYSTFTDKTKDLESSPAFVFSELWALAATRTICQWRLDIRRD